MRNQTRNALLDDFNRSDRKKRLWFYAGGLFVWLVWISGIFGNSGLIQAYKLGEVRRDMTLRITALDNEKSRLKSTLNALETDAFVQEQTVRETLGLVRQNELVFEFRP